MDHWRPELLSTLGMVFNVLRFGRMAVLKQFGLVWQALKEVDFHCRCSNGENQ